MPITQAGYFRIQGVNPDTDWLTFRDDTFPKPLDRTAQLIVPRPTARTGEGKLTGAFGKPRAILQFPWVRASGPDTQQYLYDPNWTQILSLYTALSYQEEYREVHVELRDVRTETWKVYHGYAKWPVPERTVQLNDGSNWYVNPMIEIVELTEPA